MFFCATPNAVIVSPRSVLCEHRRTFRDQLRAAARVVIDCRSEDGKRLPSPERPFDRDLFSFEDFVIEKKAFELTHPVRRKVGDVVIVAILGVVDVHGNQLVVLTFLVLHGHHSNDPRPDQGLWNDRCLAEDECIQRIAIFAPRPRHKAVVGRIKNGAVQDATHNQKSGRFFQLVLDVGAHRHFDEYRKPIAAVFGERNVVPRMNDHQRSPHEKESRAKPEWPRGNYRSAFRSNTGTDIRPDCRLRWRTFKSRASVQLNLEKSGLRRSKKARNASAASGDFRRSPKCLSSSSIVSWTMRACAFFKRDLVNRSDAAGRSARAFARAPAVATTCRSGLRPLMRPNSRAVAAEIGSPNKSS